MKHVVQKRPSEAAIALIAKEFTVAANGGLVRRGRPVGSVCRSGYVVVRIANKIHFAHRVVWFLVHGDWPMQPLDHINGERADNRPVNLRLVTVAENCQNKGQALPTNKSAGLLGVNHHPSNGRRYRAQIWCGGKNRHLGYFDLPEEAHAAYLRAKAQMHPGFVPERFA